MDKLLSEAIKEKEKIINEMNTLILSTHDNNGNPNASYAPSAIDKKGNFYIYISSLSEHTKNLLITKKTSFMIIEDESTCENLFARKRFTVKSKVSEITRDSEDWKDKIALLENKFPEQIVFLKDLTDFHLFKLKPISGLLVHGFARAFRFKGNALDELDHLNEKGHTKK
tara:strand:- start:268 stop:777 length:510 start_codon:yes stop_codon:yes gene_type:complete